MRQTAKKLPRPTQKNYYSPEMDAIYFSASQIKTFLDCPARAVAQIKGEWNPPPGQALMVGSFVDAWFEGKKSFSRWVEEHPEIFKKDGNPKAEFVKAQEMIDRASSDPVFMEYMRGRHQTIKTGTVCGFPFKIKMDAYRPGERIVDLKTTKDTQPKYKAGQGKLDFATYWNWPLQLAIYQQVEGNHLPCYIAVITKEDPIGLELVEVEQERMDAEIEFLSEKLPYFDAMKQGIIEPPRCEDCAYCRATRKLTAPKPLEFFIDKGEFEVE